MVQTAAKCEEVEVLNISQVSETSLQDVAGATEFVRRYVDYSPCISTSTALHQVCGVQDYV